MAGHGGAWRGEAGQGIVRRGEAHKHKQFNGRI